MRKIKLFTLLAAVMFATSMWAESGSFGAGLTWDYNEGTGALTITGSGAMPDYTSFTGANPAPWASHILTITSVSLPSGLTKIGEYAFYFCKNDALTSIEIPSTVTSIGASAFGNCVNVSSFEIPAGVTSIGSAAFSYCTSLTHVTFTGSIPCTLPSNAFYNSNNFEKIYVPAANGQAYYNAWSDFVDYLYEAGTGDKIEYIPVYTPCGGGLGWDYHNHVLTFNYDGVGSGVMNNYTRMGTTRAPWYSNRYDITSVVLPEGLTHIGNYAFYSLSGLTNTVALPSTLTSIGEYAFNGTYITSISLPSGMTTVGINAFNLCSKLASVTIPSSVTSIGANAFAGTKIASITLPAGLTSIGEGAFQSDHALESIVIPANVTEIGLSAFSYCTNLTSVTCLPTTAPTLVQFSAFVGCPASLIITYPNGSDQDYANKFIPFWDNLRNADTSAKAPLPHIAGTAGSLTWDLSFSGSGKFVEHEGTLAITGEGAMADYDWMNNEWAPWFYVGEFINHINIASGVTKIGEAAFANIEHVNTFIIPASVTYIGGDAFMGCDNPEAIVYCYANPANLEWHDNVSAYEGVGWVPDDFLTLTRNAWGNYEWHVQATKCVVPSNYLEDYKAKWARGGDYKWWDLNVWFASELQDGEDAEYITNALNALDGNTAPVVTLVRPLNRDGYFATLCLPFNMSAEQLAESSLHGAEIKEFTNASVEAGTINIEFTPVDHIVAGKPYFIKYEDAEVIGDALDRLDFMNVTIDKTAPVAVTHNGVTMTGTYVPKAVSAQESATDGAGVLFLGPSNTLYWPSKAGNIKPFRAYFSVAGGAGAPIRRGMPARIVERENAPTAVDFINSDEIKLNKTIENGMLVIEKDGVRYNAQGQIVK
jgi:hypothetical protein